VKLLYTAGPYRSTQGPYGVTQNILAAREVAVELWRMGFAVICPHLNTAHLDGCVDTPYEESCWIEGDLEMVRRCDAVVLLPGWEGSAGALGELEEAKKNGIPTFEWPHGQDVLVEWAGV
jgi:hypothetical protein